MCTSTINVSKSINNLIEESLMTKEQIREHLEDKYNVHSIIEDSGVRDITWEDNWVPIGQISYSCHDNKHIHKVRKDNSSDALGGIAIGALLLVCSIAEYLIAM